jgi:hypothetical protein
MYNPEGCSFFLDEISYDDADPEGLRLIRSYTPIADAKDNPIRNVAFLYDNALALMAFLARGDQEALRRAEILARSIVVAQTKDRSFKDKRFDGRWRNSYSSGPLLDSATGTARLPGWYDKGWKEDRYAVSSDTGNTAWAMLALLAAHRVLAANHKDSPYLKAAILAGEWVAKNFQAGGPVAGYTGGYDGWETSYKKLTWRSTEHNIDLYAAFMQLAQATGDKEWEKRAAPAKKFILNMKNPDDRYFWTGTKEASDRINTEVVPSDVQVWAVLALGHEEPVGKLARDAIAWVIECCRVTNLPACPNISGYQFSDKGYGLWLEGAAHLAATYHYLKDDEKARATLGELVRASAADPTTGGGIYKILDEMARGAIYAASRCHDPAGTGFKKVFFEKEEDWTYPARPHLGATAWFLLASQKANPYWFAMPPITLK